MNTNNDLQKLVAVEENQYNDHVWRVSFSAQLEIDPNLNPEVKADDIEWIGDYLIVAGGEDAEDAIHKAKKYILNPEEFGPKVKQLRIDGVRLLAVVEVY